MNIKIKTYTEKKTQVKHTSNRNEKRGELSNEKSFKKLKDVSKTKSNFNEKSIKMKQKRSTLLIFDKQKFTA